MSESYSVVIPAHHAAGTIERCLESVFSQTLTPDEMLVIDDASMDDTREIAHRCINRHRDSSISVRYISLDANVGPSAARNWGIRAAAGSYIAFLDADDVWCPQKLAIIDSFISVSHPGLICHAYSEGAIRRCEPSHEYLQKLVSVGKLLWRNPAQTSCAVVKNEARLAFDESMRYCEDHDLWLQIAERRPVVQLVGEPLTVLGRPQLSPGGLSGNVLRMRLGEMRVFYNFCRRAWSRRIWLLPALVLFSAAKHVYSLLRRTRRKILKNSREIGD